MADQSKKMLLRRRHLLQGFAAACALGGASSLFSASSARAAGTGPRFLIVLAGFGGGAIIDSLLPMKVSEVKGADTVDCFPDSEVISIAGSPFRTVSPVVKTLLGLPIDNAANYLHPDLVPFIDKWKDDLMVTTLTSTSVNHAVAQKRAVTGNGALFGRTMQECVAAAYGDGLPVPNVNMATLGFLDSGADTSLPGFAYREAIAEPLFWPISLHGKKGTQDLPDDALIAMARTMRNDRLDPASAFHQTFRESSRLRKWIDDRTQTLTQVEEADLVSKLLFVPETPDIPLSAYGLSSSPDTAKLIATFPAMFEDPLERQAALAFLLIKYGVSVAVTIAPSFTPVIGGPLVLRNPPLAFDASHNDHRYAQAVMWWRIFGIADRLAGLLKEEIFDKDTGETFWDRSMIHVATDFGRSKKKPVGEGPWGTAHDLNNGHVTLSPLVNGNTVLGGVHMGVSAEVDGHTYGFKLDSGTPDPTRTTAEAESFSGLMGALGIDLSQSNLPDVPCMRKPT